MNSEDSNKLWELFMEEVQKDSGIKVPVVNFLGSTKRYQACFKRAVDRLNELQDKEH